MASPSGFGGGRQHSQPLKVLGAILARQSGSRSQNVGSGGGFGGSEQNHIGHRLSLPAGGRQPWGTDPIVAILRRYQSHDAGHFSLGMVEHACGSFQIEKRYNETLSHGLH